VRDLLLTPAPRLPANLSEAQLDGRACIRCGAEDQPPRPVEAWSRLSSQLFECVDSAACEQRSGSTNGPAAES
jgi:hypothetical protein